MKYFVISDIHGSYYFIKKALQRVEKEQPDVIILLGDLYYHGPRNPLPKEYYPNEVAQLLNQYKDKILCVRGNCDAEVDEMISDFPFQNHIKIKIGSRNFFFTHGQKYNENHIPKNVDVLVFGHFHTGFIKEKDHVILANSGSISLPKKDTMNSYLMITEQEIILKDLDGNELESYYL